MPVIMRRHIEPEAQFFSANIHPPCKKPRFYWAKISFQSRSGESTVKIHQGKKRLPIMSPRRKYHKVRQKIEFFYGHLWSKL